MLNHVDITAGCLLDEERWPEVIEYMTESVPSRSHKKRTAATDIVERYDRKDVARASFGALNSDLEKFIRLARGIVAELRRKQRQSIYDTPAIEILKTAIRTDSSAVFEEFLKYRVSLLMEVADKKAATVLDSVMYYLALECLKSAKHVFNYAGKLSCDPRGLLDDLRKFDHSVVGGEISKIALETYREAAQMGILDLSLLGTVSFPIDEEDRFVHLTWYDEMMFYRRKTFLFILALRDHGIKVLDAFVSSGKDYAAFVEELTIYSDLGEAEGYLDVLLSNPKKLRRKVDM